MLLEMGETSLLVRANDELVMNVLEECESSPQGDIVIVYVPSFI